MEHVITWLAPPTCISCGKEGLSLCGGCADGHITPFGERCWRCNKLSGGSRTCQSCRHTGAPGRVWVTTNYESTARNLLSLYKFGQQRAASQVIAGLMSETFMRGAEGFVAKEYIVVPVPTATARIRERGFDHTDLLARDIALKLKLRNINSLRRLGQTRQLGAKREERLAQLADSFAVKNQRLVQGRNILLIDDVVTTGGTMIAATKALRAADAKSVDAAIFAKKL